MVVIQCSVPGCDFATADLSEALVIALLANHGLAHQAQPSGATQQAQTGSNRGPKLERPKIDVGVSLEEWNIFVRRWEVFRAGSGISDSSAPSQLFQCAGPALGDSLLKANPNAASESLQSLLASMRSLAVIPVATCVLRTELLQLRQERDEVFRAFTARVRGKAETCSYSAACTCGQNVDYTDHIIRDVQLNGIYDPDIRRELLGTPDILTKPVNDVIAIVENKEMARNALPSSSLSSLSSLQRLRKTQPQPQAAPSLPDQAKEASCPDCKKPFKIFTEGARGWNSKPHQMCITCYRARRQRRRQQPSATLQAVEESEPIQVASVAHSPTSRATTRKQRRRRRRRRQSSPTSNSVYLKRSRLDHHVFSKGEWRRARLRDHPRVPIVISMDQHPTSKNSKQHVTGPAKAKVSAVADSGAQSDLWSLDEFIACGFSRDDLHPVSLNLSAANRSPITIDGAFFAQLTTTSPNGQTASARSMVYVSRCVRDMYLSYDTMLNLGILPHDFPPSTGDKEHSESPDVPTKPTHINATEPHRDKESHSHQCAPCSCLRRTAPPQRPTELPFTCTPDNNDRMRSWLLNRYASSTFNTCPHQQLPCMDGPPIEIHVEQDATPKTCHTPATIPVHWQQQVHDNLLRDEALGVIERVPYGEPVTWCHRMVTTRKHDGTPRRTVDLSPLNKYCRRETFAAESPFHLARRVPTNTWKTVTDAWNGYHSVPLRESDRHLTTFITPFGRWRYKRAPQGFLSSGDGYNRRFNTILSEFERKERCVDDTIHYDTDLTEHWWRTIDFLILVGRSGIVLNPNKFQFAGKEVDFAGFRISDSAIAPLPKYLDAIKDFPSPTSTTDIRSWFGLVNQVANYAQLRDTMAPFKPFLSPRHKFMWSPELEQAFQTSKEAIIAAIHEGVEIFDMHRRTCLRPDWSRHGIGYFLLQQHCQCSPGTPDCCPQGWKITLAGSRFLSSAEQRYAAIEGEALAVAWGLEQTRYFTQGCDNLIVATDHKPLVKIFGDRTLDEIPNTRLFRLKQRTLPWRFTIIHVPGKTNLAADATSRHPSPSSTDSCPIRGLLDDPDAQEHALMAAIRNDAQDLGAISWSLIAQKTAEDPSFNHLLTLLDQEGSIDSQNPALASLSPIRDSLYSQDGVLMYNDRVVVPPSLRHRVLKHLHAAHQGTTAMELRARSIVYWPGMSNDIQATREKCADCNRNAPSQAVTPPIPSQPPSTPFESVFADFFDYGGCHFLVIGDRLSGWVEVFSSPAGTDIGGAAGLVRHLRRCFATFGVPDELSSDGGPEFIASHTKDFLQLWGVKHRISSVAFPQSNGRAEVAVKCAKRLLMSNIGPTGTLNHDGFLRAMLHLRNTPDRDCNLSPAQIIFGRPLNDSLRFINRLEKFSNPHVRPLWRQAWEAKEDALRTRIARTTESLTTHSRPLRPLALGQQVFLQNQRGTAPSKWDRSGIVLEKLDHDQYKVKVDGSGRLTLRNRRFLRAYTPATPSIHSHPNIHLSPPLSEHLHNLSPQEKMPFTNKQDNDGPSENPPAPTPLDHESPPDIPNDATGIKFDIPAPPPSTAPATAPSPRRPPRARRPPKRYEPETGRWL